MDPCMHLANAQDTMHTKGPFNSYWEKSTSLGFQASEESVSRVIFSFFFLPPLFLPYSSLLAYGTSDSTQVSVVDIYNMNIFIELLWS